MGSVSCSLQAKSIISQDNQQEAMKEAGIPKTRTLSLLNVVLDKIRFEPHVFMGFVKTLELIPSLQTQASKLVQSYQGMCYSHTSSMWLYIPQNPQP